MSELVLSEQTAAAAAEATGRRCAEMQSAHGAQIAALLEQMHANRKVRRGKRALPCDPHWPWHDRKNWLWRIGSIIWVDLAFPAFQTKHHAMLNSTCTQFYCAGAGVRS